MVEQHAGGDQGGRLQRALAAIEKMQAKLHAVAAAKNEPIAIVGMGCRLPGGIDSAESFWEFLCQDGDGIDEIPKSRWDWEQYFDADRQASGKMYVKQGGFLDTLYDFDCDFFGISPKEAARMDPQQRLILETAWEALEHAGIAPDQLVGSQTGVFMAIAGIDAVIDIFSDTSSIDPYMGTGTVHSIASGRLSYVLGLKGPSMCLDTACSSSLLAHHVAVQSLRSGECDMALVGGVNMIHRPELNLTFCNGGMLAPDGRCKTFDEAANGYVRSEGCGVFVLKRLRDAQAADDEIYALIRGTAINHDGVTSGLTVPNGPSQQAVIRTALTNARLTPDQVGYIEAHGTGTPLGDPIELGALDAVFTPNREQPLWVGSVKTNIGHLEAGAGAAGMMKAALCLAKGKIPRHLHFETPSVRFDWDRSAIKIPTQLLDWPESLPKAAGVSAFSFSGANAHLILSAPPAKPVPISGPDDQAHPQLLAISAKTKPALQDVAARLAQTLEKTDVTRADMAFSLHTGRATFPHRLSLVGSDRDTWKKKLQRFGETGIARGVDYGYQERAKKSVFIYPGQGMQYAGMGGDLFRTEPVFRSMMERCAAIADPFLDEPLLAVIYAKNPATSNISETNFTQPALFALGVSLTQLWDAWGIRPDAYFGQSMGEVTAAHLAGVFSLEDGMRLALERGRLMHGLPRNGLMAAIAADEAGVAQVLADYAHVSMAAINGVYGVVISGLREQVEAICEHFKARDIKCSPLDVSIASHCPLMEPIAEAYGAVARSLTYHKPKIPIIADLSGDWADESIATPQYWVRHILEPVRFADSIQTLHRSGYRVLVENGPTPLLLAMAREILKDDEVALVSPLQKGKNDCEQSLEACGQLFGQGIKPDWSAFHRERPGHRIVLPSYPFQHRQDWVKSYAAFGSVRKDVGLHPLVDGKLALPLLQGACYESLISCGSRSVVENHLVCNYRVVSAAAMISALHAIAGRESATQPIGFKDLNLQQPLVIGEDCPARVHFGMLRDSHGIRFSIVSFRADDGEAGAATRHLESTSLAQIREAEPCDLKNLRKEMVTLIDGDSVYQKQDHRGIRLTGSYRSLKEVHLGSNQALGLVEGGVDQNPGGMSAECLDGCFQVLIAALGDDSEAIWLPESFAEIVFYQEASPTLWAHAQLTHIPAAGDVTFVGDLKLYNSQGQCTAAFLAVKGRKLDPNQLRQQLTGRTANRIFEPVWTLSSRSATPVTSLAGRWLVFADQAGAARSWLAGMEQSPDFEVVLVEQGPSLINEPAKTIILNPEQRDHFEQVYRVLAQGPAIAGILHFWSFDFNQKPFTRLENWVTPLFGPIFHCFHAPIPLPQEIHFFTQSAVQYKADGVEISGLESEGQLAQTPLWGFARALALEHPEIKVTIQDFENEEVPDLTAIAGLETDELQVAWRGGERYVARLHARTIASTKPLTLNPRASYMITGGLGGLGLVLAERLIERGAQNLILVGRSAPKPEVLPQIQTWQAAGIAIFTRQTDMGHGPDVSQLVQWCRANCPPLAGVLHVAGILRDGTLANLNWQDFVAPFAAKMYGAWHLHQALQADALDFFACYSSATGILGSAGQTNYAAANTFLDSFAKWRTQQGCKTLSVGWGAWQGEGLANDERIMNRLASMGITPLQPGPALDDFETLLGTDLAYATVANTDWAVYSQSHEVGRRFFEALLANSSASQSGGDWHLRWRTRLDGLLGEERQQQVLAYLQDQLAHVLGWDESRTPSPELSLPEMGLDSLMGIRLKNKIADVLAWAPRIVDFIKSPSLKHLADLIASQTQPSGLQWGAPEDAVDPEMEELVL